MVPPPSLPCLLRLRDDLAIRPPRLSGFDLVGVDGPRLGVPHDDGVVQLRSSRGGPRLSWPLLPFDCTARREERHIWRLRGNRASLLDKDEASPAVQELEPPLQLVPRRCIADVLACPEIITADSNVIDCNFWLGPGRD